MFELVFQGAIAPDLDWVVSAEAVVQLQIAWIVLEVHCSLLELALAALDAGWASGVANNVLLGF